MGAKTKKKLIKKADSALRDREEKQKIYYEDILDTKKGDITIEEFPTINKHGKEMEKAERKSQNRENRLCSVSRKKKIKIRRRR